jgi:hypothetical protein
MPCRPHNCAVERVAARRNANWPAARGRPEIDEFGEHVGEVSLWIDAVQFAGLDERSNAGPILRPRIVAREQRIFSIENNWAHAYLARCDRRRGNG